jgi:hypothetical protein
MEELVRRAHPVPNGSHSYEAVIPRAHLPSDQGLRLVRDWSSQSTTLTLIRRASQERVGSSATSLGQLWPLMRPFALEGLLDKGPPNAAPLRRRDSSPVLGNQFAVALPSTRNCAHRLRLRLRPLDFRVFAAAVKSTSIRTARALRSRGVPALSSSLKRISPDSGALAVCIPMNSARRGRSHKSTAFVRARETAAFVKDELDTTIAL